LGIRQSNGIPRGSNALRAGWRSFSLVDDLNVRPSPWRRSAEGDQPEAVRDNLIQSVVDLRRAIDVLRARPDVDPNRIAYVGHSSGAHWGAILSAVDRRLKTVVLMTGVPSERTIMMESDDPDYVNARKATPPEVFEKYLKVVSALDAINYVAHASPTPLLFQFARFEQYFDEAAMQRMRERQANPNSFFGMTRDTD
jgi:acetyl esterase/lipase